jgi:hypothetical protein
VAEPNAVRAEMATRNRGPHLGIVAIVFTGLFNAGLYQVISLTGGPHFPLPWDSSANVAAYFRDNPLAAVWCAFLQFGSAVALGVYTATFVSRLHFHGVRAAGASIAWFGGLMTAFNLALSALIIWVLAQPGIAQNDSLAHALYYLMYTVGGVGYSVPLGLLIAGICVPSAFMNLLPRWLLVFGFGLAVVGELSILSLLTQQAVPLIPLTRFPGFLWLIAAGFALPRGISRPASQVG